MIGTTEAVATEVRPSVSARHVVKDMQENVGSSNLEEEIAIAILNNSSPRKMQSTT